MKTLFIIYVLLSVLVVLFSWIVNVELKKQIVTLRKANEANVAEIKSRTDELNSVIDAFTKYKAADKQSIETLKNAEKMLATAKEEIDDAKNLIDKYSKANDDLTDIVETLLNRHGYNKLEGFDDTLEIAKMLEFVRNNDTSKKRSRKKSGNKDKAECSVEEIERLNKIRDEIRNEIRNEIGGKVKD